MLSNQQQIAEDQTSAIQEGTMELRHARSGTGLIVGVTLACQLARLIYVFVGGESRIVGHVADDAFYYFQLAKNYSESASWTFDGSAPATGFHILWAYFLALVFLVKQNISISELFVFCGAIGIACYAISIAIVSRALNDWYGRDSVLAVLLVFLGTSIFQVSTIGVEAGPALLITALAFALVVRKREASAIWFATGLGIGFVGVLVRSDFGLVPVCLAACAFFFWKFRRTADFSQVMIGVSLLIGAILGLVLLFTHTYIVSGRLLQSSAEMKLYWSALAGNHVSASLTFIASLFAYPFRGAHTFLIVRFVLIAALIFISYLSLRAIKKTSRSAFPFLFAAITACAYILVYSRDSRSIQLWYSVAFAIPLTVLFAPLLAELAAKYKMYTWVIVCALAFMGVALSFRPIWPHQFAMRDAGIFLARNKSFAPVGAWNAGTLSFVSGRAVTNLDGLVNDDILPYAKSGSLARYIVKRKIRYLMDYAAMFSDPMSARGGYQDGVLKRCATRVETIDEGQQASIWEGSYITLYEVDFQCIDRQGVEDPSLRRAGT